MPLFVIVIFLWKNEREKKHIENNRQGTVKVYWTIVINAVNFLVENPIYWPIMNCNLLTAMENFIKQSL